MLGSFQTARLGRQLRAPAGRAAPLAIAPAIWQRHAALAPHSATATRARRALVARSVAEGSSLKELEMSLQAAVASEDYALAAAIKRQMDELQAADPRKQLEAELTKAVAEERYEVGAASCRARPLSRSCRSSASNAAARFACTARCSCTHTPRVTPFLAYVLATSSSHPGATLQGCAVNHGTVVPLVKALLSSTS